METRVCSHCGEEKPFTLEFYMQGKNKCAGVVIPYWYKFCKTCHNKKSLTKTRKYKQKNRCKLSASQKVYHQSHKDGDAATKKLWYEKNKVVFLCKVKARLYERRKTDIAFVLKEKISGRVWAAIKGRKGGKSIRKYLPYTMQELKDHLEKQFEPWMTWDNYGTYRLDIWNNDDSTTWTWNIDHIIPHSRFKYTSMEDQEFKDCWALSNLRPYSSKQNIIDGDNR